MIWFIGGDDVRLRVPLLLALRRRGFEVGAAGSEAGADFDAAGIPYARYELARGLNPAADLRSLRQLRRLFERHRPDVVQAFDTKPTILAPLAAARAGVAGRVCTITGMGHLFSSNAPAARALRPLYRGLQRWASGRAGWTVFQNEDDRAYFIAQRIVPESRARLVRGSGIDLEEMAASRPDAQSLKNLRAELGLGEWPVVILIARLVVEKGVREFLEAARLLAGEGNPARFVLVGPTASEGRRAIPMREIEAAAPHVLYLGPRRDVPALLGISSVFALPTWYREGVPRVLLEAGASGLPLIATDMPGCRDVVKDGWNGRLVPVRDAGALAAAIRGLLADPGLRAFMGERSRAHVHEHFGLEKVADGYAELYREILGQTS
ncbi:MAG: glycosyltransferase family 4 protein [Candidatus Polarisedimenticolia bacterium]